MLQYCLRFHIALAVYLLLNAIIVFSISLRQIFFSLCTPEEKVRDEMGELGDFEEEEEEEHRSDR